MSLKEGKMGELRLAILGRKVCHGAALRALTSFFGSTANAAREGGRWSLSSGLFALSLSTALLGAFTLYPLLYNNRHVIDESLLLQSLLLSEMILLSAYQVVSVYSRVAHFDRVKGVMGTLDLLDGVFSRIGRNRLVLAGPPLGYAAYNTVSMILIGLFDNYLLSSEMPLLTAMSCFYHSTWLAFVMHLDVFCIYLLIFSIQVSLSYLNRYLASIRSDVRGVMDKSKCETLELCCKLYDQLCTQVDRLNDIFGIQLLIVFTFCFAQIVDQLYFMLFLSTSAHFHHAAGHFFVAFLWSSFASSLIVSITRVCDSTVEEAKEFNTLLYQIMMDDTKKELSSHKKLRLHIAMKREINFSAHGFFTVDHTLLHSMVAAATTYLVILLQFG